MYGDVEVSIEASLTGVRSARVQLQGTTAFNFDVGVNQAGSLVLPGDRHVFFPASDDPDSTIHHPTGEFHFTVLGVPITVEFGLQLSASISANITGIMRGDGPAVSAHRALTLGAEYRTGHWRALRSGTMQLTTRPPTAVVTGASEVQAQFDVSIVANVFGAWPVRFRLQPWASSSL